MNDGKVSLTSTLAWATWALSGAFVILCLLASGDPHTTTMGMALCTVAIILAAAASTLHVRSFFCSYSEGYRNAYQLGRDAGREEAQVPLQRVH